MISSKLTTPTQHRLKGLQVSDFTSGCLFVIEATFDKMMFLTQGFQGCSQICILVLESWMPSFKMRKQNKTNEDTMATL